MKKLSDYYYNSTTVNILSIMELLIHRENKKKCMSADLGAFRLDRHIFTDA